MKHSAHIIALAALALAASALQACKTTEANYREAYEKTMAARQSEAAIDSTVYGANRRQMTSRTVTAADGSAVEVRTHFVKVTDGGGGVNENLHRYNVVVGQFKQLFNAKSLRNRLADAGYPTAFVVETAEPYYYIVLQSFDDVEQANSVLKAFKQSETIAMKEPCPFILDATARRRPKK